MLVFGFPLLVSGEEALAFLQIGIKNVSQLLFFVHVFFWNTNYCCQLEDI